MQMADGDARVDQLHLLELKSAHVRDFASIIKAMSFREDGTFQATPQGMRIIVDDYHCEQAVAYLSNDLFSTFTLREQSVLFRLPLTVISECISMHRGSGATLKMTYDGFGEPVKLILEEDGVVVEMNVQTLTADEVLDFDFDKDDVVFKVIMKPYMLKEAIKELDASSPTVTIAVNCDEFSLITEGEIGKAVTKFPKHSEQVERLECMEPVTLKYLLSLIRHMSSAFAIANKVSLQCDSRGVLSMQFMVEQAEHKQVYMEFYCAPYIDDE